MMITHILYIFSAVFIFSLGITACLSPRPKLREIASDVKEFQPIVVPHTPQEVQPESQYALEELRAEMTKIEARLEDLEHNWINFKKIEARQMQLEQDQASFIESFQAMGLYEKAQSQIDENNCLGAIETLTLYLKNTQVKKIEDATFQRAECYFKLKQYKKSIVDYSYFVDKGKKSTHTPEALYKIALCFDALNMKEDAHGFYQELIEKYPKFKIAKKIKKKGKP